MVYAYYASAMLCCFASAIQKAAKWRARCFFFFFHADAALFAIEIFFAATSLMPRLRFRLFFDAFAAAAGVSMLMSAPRFFASRLRVSPPSFYFAAAIDAADAFFR